jgi:hypothetical protein
MDRTGHTTLAEWTSEDDATTQRAQEALAFELERGLIASALHDGSAAVVRELPLDAELVTLRRPIVGG